MTTFDDNWFEKDPNGHRPEDFGLDMDIEQDRTEWILTTPLDSTNVDSSTTTPDTFIPNPTKIENQQFWEDLTDQW